MVKKEQSLKQELAESYRCWQYLFENGGSDPFWSDGVNLNLIRNHIIYYKLQMKEAGIDSEEYYWSLPEMVDDSYMANKDMIFSDAQRTYDIVSQDSDFRWLKENVYNFSPELVKKFNVHQLINRMNNLQEALQKNDWVTLRRFRRFSSAPGKDRERSV